jgi:hypothetical protein
MMTSSYETCKVIKDIAESTRVASVVAQSVRTSHVATASRAAFDHPGGAVAPVAAAVVLLLQIGGVDLGGALAVGGAAAAAGAEVGEVGFGLDTVVDTFDESSVVARLEDDSSVASSEVLLVDESSVVVAVHTCLALGSEYC